MGIQFSIVYDVIIAAVFIGMIFAGGKKGFAAAAGGLAAVVIAFICASIFSSPITDMLYVNYVEQPLTEAVDSRVDEAMSAVHIEGLDDLYYDNVRISGVSASEMQSALDYAGTAKTVVDLSDLSLSGTGIENADLSLFGIAANTDFSSINAKTAEFTMAEIEQHGLAKMCVVQYLAISVQHTDFFSEFSRYAAKIGDTVPLIFGGTAEKIENGSVQTMRCVISSMLDGTTSAKQAIITGIVEPYFKVTVKTVLFAAIFTVLSIVLGIIANALKIVNKIPFVGGVNIFAGCLVGLVQALFTVFLICIVVRTIIILSGGNILLFNEMTINSTRVFKYFYDLKSLNFLI